ncbi:hypothetical protein SAMN05216309_1631 [Nitrosomonas europaea]|nr:hypothetical protein SAMN05216310_1311 [Nitrosomonas europaea]SET48927.1 hypothetical protein SAMN05216309_1631 [Nitrosomonas europaea]SJZ82011.1 hypothetical protein SAMN02745113_01956 [Nitrosomonas europaea]HBF24145.1 hypothetical protein [Nitrosomonas sp.]
MKQRTKIWLRKARKPFLDYMRNISFQIVVAGLIGFLGYRALTASLGGPRVVSVICLAGFVVILIVSFIANASLLKEDLYSSFYAWQALTSKRFRRFAGKIRIYALLRTHWRFRRVEILTLSLWYLFQLFICVGVFLVGQFVASGYTKLLQ